MRLPERPTMTVPEAAEALGVHRDTVYDAVRRGELPAIRLGRTVRIPTARIARMLDLPTQDDGGGQALAAG